MIYGYARVSSIKQKKFGNSLEDQRKVLEQYGCDEIVEEQYSAKTMNRPRFTELTEKMEAGDTLVVTKLDRYARTTVEGIQTTKDLMSRGIRIHILNMGLVEDTPMGNLILTVMSAFAEYERAMILERTEAGKEVKREAGTLVEGRPVKNVDIRPYIEKTKRGEMTVAECCKELGISRSLWYNKVRECA